MKKPGRRSAADLETIGLKPVAIAARLEAPYDISDEAADVWRQVVESLPADWFTPASAPVLAQYCRTVIAARRVAQLVHQAERGEGEYDVDYHLKLLQAQDRISSTIKALAASLRLTPQSRYTPQRAATQAAAHKAGPMPWEF